MKKVFYTNVYFIMSNLYIYYTKFLKSILKNYDFLKIKITTIINNSCQKCHAGKRQNIFPCNATKDTFCLIRNQVSYSCKRQRFVEVLLFVSTLCHRTWGSCCPTKSNASFQNGGLFDRDALINIKLICPQLGPSCFWKLTMGKKKYFVGLSHNKLDSNSVLYQKLRFFWSLNNQDQGKC